MSKVQYKTDTSLGLTGGRTAYKFTIAASIAKTHFKALMQIAKLYKAGPKSGYICAKDKDAFLALVEKIEKSNDKVCAKSHAKSIAKAKQRGSAAKGCQHEDLGSRGYTHGDTVRCPDCGARVVVW